MLTHSARILLIRHGQSTWNAEGRWQGQQDAPLSRLGEEQSRAAAAVVGGFDLIAASTLERAMTTATIIAEALGIGPVIGDADLVERSFGSWEGLTRAEIDERYPGYRAQGRLADDHETDDAVVARALDALSRVAARTPGGEALVVAHGAVIGALERAGGVRREGRIPNLGGRWFELSLVDAEMSDGDVPSWLGELTPGEAVNLVGTGIGGTTE